MENTLLPASSRSNLGYHLQTEPSLPFTRREWLIAALCIVLDSLRLCDPSTVAEVTHLPMMNEAEDGSNLHRRV